ncbi:MAG: hypothetical protein WHS38_10750 [Thermodesulforhabdaceae bacterium]|jgi:tetratricopeptide (TPR) repeat protein
MDGVIDRAEWYEEILKEDSSSPVFAELAELLYQDGRFDEVIDICRKGLSANPENIKGRVYLGLALLATGQREEGILYLKAAKDRLRDYATLFRVLSEVYKQEGDGEEADRMFTISRLLDASRAEKAIIIPEPIEIPTPSFVKHQPAPRAKEPAPSSQKVVIISRLNKMIALLEEKLLSARSSSEPHKTSLFTQDERDLIRKCISLKPRRVRGSSIH